MTTTAVPDDAMETADASAGAAVSARRSRWFDVLLIVLLMAAHATVVWHRLSAIPPVVTSRGTIDSYFHADVVRVVENMTDRESDRAKSAVHPLFRLIAYPLPKLMVKLLHVSPLTAVHLQQSAVAGLWAAAFYGVLRLARCRWYDALLFTVLVCVSAAALMWFAVPETFPYGSLTILLGLLAVAWFGERPVREAWLVAAGVLTFSITVTNGMVGGVWTVLKSRWPRFVQVLVNTFFVAALLWGVSRHFFKNTEFFLAVTAESSHVMDDRSGGVLDKAAAFLAHGVVMPRVEQYPHHRRDDFPIMSVQRSAPGSASWWGRAGVAAWAIVLGCGVWMLVLRRERSTVWLVIGLSALGQFALHLIYGDETFLAALHFTPLLILVGAYACTTPIAPVARTAAAVLVVCAVLNNLPVLRQVTGYYQAGGKIDAPVLPSPRESTARR